MYNEKYKLWDVIKRKNILQILIRIEYSSDSYRVKYFFEPLGEETLNSRMYNFNNNSGTQVVYDLCNDLNIDYKKMIKFINENIKERK